MKIERNPILGWRIFICSAHEWKSKENRVDENDRTEERIHKVFGIWRTTYGCPSDAISIPACHTLRSLAFSHSVILMFTVYYCYACSKTLEIMNNFLVPVLICFRIIFHSSYLRLLLSLSPSLSLSLSLRFLFIFAISIERCAPEFFCALT